MKYLKYAGIAVVVLVALFLIVGLMTPSVYYESEVVVSKSAEETWAVMSDEAKLYKWIEGFKRNELVSGTPNTVGAVTRVYVEDNGQEMSMLETITKIVPNEVMAMNFSMDFMEMDYELNLKEENGQTVITTKSTTMGNGLFAKSMIAFMKGSMKEQEMKNMNMLKQTVEENTKDYFQTVQVE